MAAEPAPIALKVALPPAFEGSALVTHTRVDDTHGNAFAVWESQGSPAQPSTTQLAALREAMESVVFAPEHVVRAADGAVSLSFELPRFGISLVTLTPAQERAPATSAQGGAGCSCRLTLPTRGPPLALIALLVGAAIALCRRSANA